MCSRYAHLGVGKEKGEERKRKKERKRKRKKEGKKIEKMNYLFFRNCDL
jgi:hypothetical protein